MEKILIITDNLPDQINGVVTTYKNLETHAQKDGYEIEYIHAGMFPHIDCPAYPEIKLSNPKGMWKLINASHADYIHIATEGPMGVYARRYLKIKRIPYTSAYHTKFPEAVKKIAKVPEFLTWPLIRWFHANSQTVLTTTNSMVEQLESKGFKNNVRAWSRGVNREIFQPKETGDKKGALVLLNVGRVSAEKNLTAFYDIKIPGAIKIQVGDGPMRKKYERMYPDVSFVGAKRGESLAYYYNLADVFVFPSKWDTFGLVMIEAMACGTPVAAYPVQGPLDVIDKNITGSMNHNLQQAVVRALDIDRETVFNGSLKWSWQNAWNIFKDSLVPVKKG